MVHMNDISWDPSRMEFKPVSMVVTHEGSMHFRAKTGSGLNIPIDAHVHLGGAGTFPNPIDYLFASLGGCIGVKIMLDLGDKGYIPEKLMVATHATRKQDLPATFETVHHVITLKGEFDDETVIQILTRTMTLLCPIAVIIGDTAKMTWEYRLEK